MNHLRQLTSIELESVKSLAAAGYSSYAVQKRMKCGDKSWKRLMDQHGITFDTTRAKPKERRRRTLSEEQETLFRHMVKNHCTRADLKRGFRMNLHTVRRLLAEFGIDTDPRARMMRRKAVIHVPPDELQAAVQKLRTRYCPVCAEDTIRYPQQTPEAYRETTLFRVGHMENVPAARVVEMARERMAA